MDLSTQLQRVLVTDYTWEDTSVEAALLGEQNTELLCAPTGDEAELRHLAAEADAILTCFAQVTSSVIQAGSRLQVIARYGIGVDNIDVKAATERGIIVTNVPAYCVEEVAEYTIGCLLAFARNLIQYNAAIRQSDWSLSAHRRLYRVSGKALGIIGFGSIGRTVAQKATALGLRLLVYDEQADRRAVEALGGAVVSLSTLLAEADFVTLHVPLTPDTYHLIGADALRQMKKTALLINAARGAIVDVEALVTALHAGQIAGAALDVFEPDKLPAEHPIFQLPNVIATPHTAFYSEESLHSLRTRAASSVAAVLQGKLPESVVNPEVLQLEKWANLR